MAIISHTPWDGADRPTWANDATLAHETLLDERAVRRGIKRLRGAGMLDVRYGTRPGARRVEGRILVPKLSGPAKLLIPDRLSMGRLWSACREVRKQPVSLVTITVGAYAMACDARGHRPRDWSLIPGKRADLRRFVGARKNQSFTRRLRDLEAIGLIEREGNERYLAPAAAWSHVGRLMLRTG